MRYFIITLLAIITLASCSKPVSKDIICTKYRAILIDTKPQQVIPAYIPVDKDVYGSGDTILISHSGMIDFDYNSKTASRVLLEEVVDEPVTISRDK